VNKVIVALFIAFIAAITGIALYTNLNNRDLIPPPPATGNETPGKSG
jgi:hypothetical protein